MRLRSRRLPPVTPEHLVELLLGTAFFAGAGFGDDEAARRQAWQAHREELVALWQQEPKPPWSEVRGQPWHVEVAWILGSPTTLPWAAYRYDGADAVDQDEEEEEDEDADVPEPWRG